MLAPGTLAHHQPPKYIAVQVSPERWVICERIEDARTADDIGEDSDWYYPCYAQITKRLTLGQANNVLTKYQERRK